MLKLLPIFIFAIFLPVWASISIIVIALLVIAGDMAGVKRAGSGYRFDEGVDR